MQRQVPGILWISILGLITLSTLQFAAAVRHPVIFIAVAANLLIAAGLYYGRRWSYIVLLALAIAGVLAAFARHPGGGLLVLVLNGVIVGPVLLSHDYFWNAARQRTARSRYCHRCGKSLASVSADTCPRCGEPIRSSASLRHG